MTDRDLTVLVVDDDFRVADMHAGIVNALPGFTVAATVNTVAAARDAAAGHRVDLALADVYLPDGSGVDLVRELRCDALMLTAASDGATVRAALAAGALGVLVKPFTQAALASRLAGYARYRRLLAAPGLTAHDIDTAVAALRPTVTPAGAAPAPPSPTRQLVLDAIEAADTPLSAGEVATAIGISRATAQRYLATLTAAGDVLMRLRYGSTGRPEQEFLMGPPKR